MEKAYFINRRSAIIALLLSLLLHFCTVLYVALERSGFQIPFLQPTQQETVEPSVEKKQPLTEWAETKGRSGYGSPVLFRDEPDEEFMPDIAQTTEETATAPETDEDTFSEEEESNTKQTSSAIETKEEPQSSPTVSTPSEKETTSLITKTEQTSPIKQDVTPSIKPLQRQSTINTKSRASAPAKPLVMNKKPLSLAQLAQGVMNYVKEEGQYAVSMIGKKGGVPSDEQIKYERYLQKLSWCLQNSFTINNDRFPAQCNPSGTVDVFLALNKDGTVHNLRIVKSSGDPRIDAFFVFAFHDASTSFPPVPHYLPHNPFSITYVIDLNPHRDNFSIYRR